MIIHKTSNKAHSKQLDPKVTELTVTNYFLKLYYNYFAQLLKELC